MIPKPEISPLLLEGDELSRRSEALRVELSGEEAAASRSRRRSRSPAYKWRWLLALAVVPLIGVGVATAAGVFSAEEMDIDGGMGCYSEASLKPEVISIIGPVEDPVAACAEMWRKGEMHRDMKQAPALVACAGPAQPVRVIPGSGPADCERLGLVELPSDYSQAARGWRPPND